MVLLHGYFYKVNVVMAEHRCLYHLTQIEPEEKKYTKNQDSKDAVLETRNGIKAFLIKKAAERTI